MSNSLWPQGLWPARLLCPWEFSRQEYWRGLPFPFPEDLPDPGLLHSSQILSCLRHHRSPKCTLELKKERYTLVIEILLTCCDWCKRLAYQTQNRANEWWETHPILWIKWKKFLMQWEAWCDQFMPNCPWNSSGKNTGVYCHFLLQGIFWT